MPELDNPQPTIQAQPAARVRAGGAVPLGRVLAVACLVPILAMIVLGASRFNAIRDVDVDSAPIAPSTGAVEQRPSGDGEMMFSFLPGRETAFKSDETASISGEDLVAAPRMMRVVETRMMVVTAYCPCIKCCGKNARGVTASGKPVSYNGGKFVAADTRVLAFGTLVKIPGYHDDVVVEVIDRGGAIKGDKIDVFFPSHEAARKWGRQMLPVQIVEPLEPAADFLSGAQD